MEKTGQMLDWFSLFISFENNVFFPKAFFREAKGDFIFGLSSLIVLSPYMDSYTTYPYPYTTSLVVFDSIDNLL